MREWYRRQTWTKSDEEEFFAKLGRARKEGRAQYLKIQAIELTGTKKKELLKIADTLLKRMLNDFPNDYVEKGPALHALGDIGRLNGNFDEAIDYYKQAIDFEEVFPNVVTNAWLDYSELIIKTGATTQYDFVEKMLMARIPGLLFPVAKYKSYAILSIISKHESNPEQAKQFAALADQNANAETSGLRYHKYLGVVNERDRWLDRLVKRD